MEKIKIHLSKTSTSGVFHDSRQDVNTLKNVCNILIEKVNQLIDENKKLKAIVNVSKDQTPLKD